MKLNALFRQTTISVVFLVNRVALSCVFLRVLHFSSGSFIPPLLHTHLHFIIEATLNRRTDGPNLGTFLKTDVFFWGGGNLGA